MTVSPSDPAALHPVETLGLPIRVANAITCRLCSGYGPDGHDLLAIAATAESGGHFIALDLATRAVEVRPLNHLECYPIVPASDGAIYVGVSDGRVMRYRPQDGSWEELADLFGKPGRPINHCRAMAEGPDGWLYCGSVRGERARVNIHTGRSEALPPIPEEGSWYVASVAALSSGKIGFGVGGRGRIFVHDPERGEDIAQWVPDEFGTGFILLMEAGPEVLYAVHNISGKRLAFRIASGQYLGSAPWPALQFSDWWSLWRHSSGYGGGQPDFYIEPDTDAIVACDGELVHRWHPLRPELTGTIALSDYEPHPDLAAAMEWDTDVECTVLRYGPKRLTVTETFDLGLPGSERGIHSLTMGPDGRVYGACYQNMRLFRYDPVCGELVDLGNHCPSWSGEVYSYANWDGKLVCAMYIYGGVTVYDPAELWQPGRAADSNPRLVGAFGHYVYRPQDSAMGPDGRLWSVGPAGYGPTGGGVAWMDLTTGDTQTVRLPEAPWRVMPMDAATLLIGSPRSLRWWSAAEHCERASVSWPGGPVADCLLWDAECGSLFWLSADRLRVGRVGDAGTLAAIGEIALPAAGHAMRRWGDLLIVGGPQGFVSVDPATGASRLFCAEPLPHRWVFTVGGDWVYFSRGSALMRIAAQAP